MTVEKFDNKPISKSSVLVSVVIPTFNRAEMLADALTSVAQQSYRPIELIIADDGSTDNTAEVVQKLVEQHQTTGFELSYYRQKNQGGNPARNLGIQHARGEYVAFLDSDDCWDANKLELQIAEIEKDPNAGAVYCGVRHVKASTGEVTEPTNRIYPSGDILSQMLVRDVTSPTSAYVVKKAVFDLVGCFDVDLQARQDWDMWIRVASVSNISCIAEPLVDFREHEGIRTASNPMKEIHAYARIMEKYRDLRVQQNWLVNCAAKSAYFKRMGRVHFHHKISTSQALIYLFKAVLCWPFDFDAWAALVGVLIPSGVRAKMHRIWNRLFGRTRFGIRSH